MAADERIEYRGCRLKISNRNGWQIKIQSAIAGLNAQTTTFADRESAIAEAVKLIDAGHLKFWA